MRLTEVPASPTSEQLDPVAANFSRPESNPDVVVTCVYDRGCAAWIRSLRNSKWSPKAQVFTVCIGMDSFVNEVGETDAMYMTGISPWDPSLGATDEIVRWTAKEFARRFVDYTSRTPTYHSASAAASVGALVQAIQRADSFDATDVAAVLATREFPTLYGKLRFNDDGQSESPVLFLQYDGNATVHTVFPLEERSGTLVYPMPTWDHRDCRFLSTCETGSQSTIVGTCTDDGSCRCSVDEATSSGVGPKAKCVLVPKEDHTFISPTLKAFGIVLFGLQALLTVLCAAWTVYYSPRTVVKASQPIFLCLVAFGSFVMSLGIIPIGIQGKYRYVQDPSTGQLLTDVDNPEIGRIDAACMALPWLFSIGFSIVFSALFAKIWRIRKIFKAVENFVRRAVPVKEVLYIMVGVILVQVVILLCWQFIDPLRWQRHVIFDDLNGYPTKSVGYCASDNVYRFLIPLICIDGLMLFYALYLCFVTRKIESDYQEGTWITASVLSIIQILLLSIPILVIVENDNNAYYFVRAAVLFLISSTVTMLIFFPKMYRLHFKPVQRRNNNGGSGFTNSMYATRNMGRSFTFRNRFSSMDPSHEPRSSANSRNSNGDRGSRISNGDRDSRISNGDRDSITEAAEAAEANANNNNTQRSSHDEVGQAENNWDFKRHSTSIPKRLTIERLDSDGDLGNTAEEAAGTTEQRPSLVEAGKTQYSWDFKRQTISLSRRLALESRHSGVNEDNTAEDTSVEKTDKKDKIKKQVSFRQQHDPPPKTNGTDEVDLESGIEENSVEFFDAVDEETQGNVSE
mmetsp:Transcript_37887/g.64709  ORF Transcript_37887/g.64709 Transcript_37887/m.64709 type:complete len:798 (+) Transcript_37887:172-2565(+)